MLLLLLLQFAPEVHVGDGLGMDLKLSNQVFNSLKQHCYSEQRRSAKLHEKKEHSTSVRRDAHTRGATTLQPHLNTAPSALRNKPWTLAPAC